ncbi:MAG: hemerythrin domain-containing protein [Myxococcota bacterium]
MFDKLKEGLRETLTGSTPENDLRARLHADHAEVSRLIDELLASGAYEVSMREDLRDQIVVGLTAHAHAEEEVVYDFLKVQPQTRTRTEHAIREHAEIEHLVTELASYDCSDPALTDLVTELKRVVTHHVHDEENELLPNAERDLGAPVLARLIPAFNARKMVLMARSEAVQRRRGGLDIDADLAPDGGFRSIGGLEETNSQF